MNKCKHTLKQHQMMKESRASSELEGAKTDKTICELIDMTEYSEPKAMKKGLCKCNCEPTSLKKDCLCFPQWCDECRKKREDLRPRSGLARPMFSYDNKSTDVEEWEKEFINGFIAMIPYGSSNPSKLDNYLINFVKKHKDESYKEGYADAVIDIDNTIKELKDAKRTPLLHIRTQV